MIFAYGYFLGPWPDLKWKHFVIYVSLFRNREVIDIFWIDAIYTFVEKNRDAICFEAEENLLLYPVEHIPDQGNAQRTKYLRLKRELHWIKTLGTQFPHGMNHKITRKGDISITFPYNSNSRKAFKISRNIYTNVSQCIKGPTNVLI